MTSADVVSEDRGLLVGHIELRHAQDQRGPQGLAGSLENRSATDAAPGCLQKKGRAPAFRQSR